MTNEQRPCPCGSGRDSQWLNDARGIPCCRTCPNCHQEKVARYNPGVLNDPNYETDEQIEED
jgi:hypothetical protein